MTPNLMEILITTARNRIGYNIARFGSDFPDDDYIKQVSHIVCDSPTFDEWINDIYDAIKRIEDGYAIYKVFK